MAAAGSNNFLRKHSTLSRSSWRTTRISPGRFESAPELLCEVSPFLDSELFGAGNGCGLGMELVLLLRALLWLRRLGRSSVRFC